MYPLPRCPRWAPPPQQAMRRLNPAETPLQHSICYTWSLFENRVPKKTTPQRGCCPSCTFQQVRGQYEGCPPRDEAGDGLWLFARPLIGAWKAMTRNSLSVQGTKMPPTSMIRWNPLYDSGERSCFPPTTKLRPNVVKWLLEEVGTG